ncbi:hypothetical protein GF362_06095, partial [Candidatus Dojkabacteria bacterium]|nr:hypothetical protein [Candidatus Dojkabacteria bacterium]
MTAPEWYTDLSDPMQDQLPGNGTYDVLIPQAADMPEEEWFSPLRAQAWAQFDKETGEGYKYFSQRELLNDQAEPMPVYNETGDIVAYADVPLTGKIIGSARYWVEVDGESGYGADDEAWEMPEDGKF